MLNAAERRCPVDKLFVINEKHDCTRYSALNSIEMSPELIFLNCSSSAELGGQGIAECFCRFCRISDRLEGRRAISGKFRFPIINATERRKVLTLSIGFILSLPQAGVGCGGENGAAYTSEPVSATGNYRVVSILQM
ncbi:hypothetical protein [Massilia sp. CCM 8734]|uniref:hypothetical protein n=1 Tax=Massilia sp. CCM 8734 TaxID=2609283 RepID=UPI0014224E57|nr:hypothetical protein [Massilia sp. CCM 8734]NHZ94236.1 hypothetical protein [Massilia sp. CCM 8734]